MGSVDNRSVQRWANDKELFDCLIAVDMKGEGHIISFPLDPEMLDGTACEDNSFRNVPSRPGLYQAKVQYHFVPGYLDGYRCDSENEWWFEVIDARLALTEQRERGGQTLGTFKRLAMHYHHAEKHVNEFSNCGFSECVNLRERIEQLATTSI